MSTYIYTRRITLPVEALANIDLRIDYIKENIMKDHLEVEFDNGDYPLLITQNRVSDAEDITLINELRLPVYYWNLDNEGGHPEFKYGDVIIVMFASGIQRMIVTNIR